MQGRIWLPMIGGLCLCACQPHASAPDGTYIVDEDVVLTRNDANLVDEATRELDVDGDVILVASAEENLTDITLGLEATKGNGATRVGVAVENHLAGSGREIAVLEARDGAHVRVTLVGGQDAKQPGKVRLRVQQFSMRAQRNPEFATRLAAFRAWTRGTDEKLRASTARKIVPAEMQVAIDALDASASDAALAAEARLVRARQLGYFKSDWRESRAEAQRAAAAFAKLPQPDVLGVARANYVEALALAAMSLDTASKDPGPEEAAKLSHDTLMALTGASSPLGPVERARALGEIGQLAVNQMDAIGANTNFEAAQALYQEQGYLAGVREMRIDLAVVLVEMGRFTEAARVFDELFPQFPGIRDPELRAQAFIATARSQSFSGRVDEAAELLLKALPLAREHEFRELEARTLQELGYIYQNRGDYLASTTFLEESLNLAREGKDVGEYVTALASAGQLARANGDLERAFRLHKEAVRLAPTPVLAVRTRFDLAADYYRANDFPAAIATDREALAIDLHDPNLHVFTDGKIALALFLIEYEKATAADLADADRMLTASMATSVSVKDEWRVIFTTRVRAQLDDRLGRRAAALAGFEDVFVRGRAYRERSGSTETRSTMLKDEEAAFQGYLDIVLADVAKRGPGVFRPASPAELVAVRRFERARQESFGALRVGKLDAQSAARVDQLMAEMGRKSLVIASMVGQDLAPAQVRELRTLQLDMASMHTEIELVRAAAANKQVKAAGVPEQVAQEWRPLAPGAVQLSYAMSRDHVYATVRSAAGTDITVLGPPRKDLEQELAEINGLDARKAPEKLEAALAQVSADLLPAGMLPRDTNAVEIVAEGRIASVPFAALHSPTDANRRLIETHEISMVTSLLGTADAPRLAQPRPFRLVALASGSGTYRAATLDPAPSLQAATKEINTVAQLFKARDPSAAVKLLTGPAGNSAALRDIWASGADVVHFATHALADLRQPVASLLVLPAIDDSGKATYLTAGQVQGWRGDAGLVFLSACESAIGPPQFAVGLPGLQRAFLRAGARGVIATLAPIEDVLAQQFAADFYTRYTSGESAQRALSETQRAWLTPKPGMSASEQMRRRLTALSHAYFAG